MTEHLYHRSIIMNLNITNSIIIWHISPWDVDTSLRQSTLGLDSTMSRLFSPNLFVLKSRAARRNFWRQNYLRERHFFHFLSGNPPVHTGKFPSAISIASEKPGIQSEPTISSRVGPASNDGNGHWLCPAGDPRDSRHLDRDRSDRKIAPEIGTAERF
jgi:hypothetical protein